MKTNIYKKLYFHAFTRLTDLIHEAQQIQVDLEEESEDDEQ